MILAIRTDRPEAEISLWKDGRVDSYTWEAHRKLAETLHVKIYNLLTKHNADWPDITGVVCYKGPGSFTGLRIGLTVGNALANSLGVPIVGQMGENWQNDGIQRLLQGESEHIAVPDYGRPARITQPKK